MSNKTPRLNRLFNTSGNCFDVAIDHGMFNERSFLNGIENMHQAIETIVAASPDAIQLPPGTAPRSGVAATTSPPEGEPRSAEVDMTSH